MTTLVARQSTVSWFLGKDLLRHAIIDSFRRLTPRYQWRNPVMFVVYIGSILTTVLWDPGACSGTGEAPAGFILAVTLWLWVTLLFANFEAIAEAQQGTGRIAQERAQGHDREEAGEGRIAGAAQTVTPSSRLRKGDIVYVEG